MTDYTTFTHVPDQQSLKVYLDKNAGEIYFDASQGDGDASLPRRPKSDFGGRPHMLQIEHGLPMICLSERILIASPWSKSTGSYDSSSGWGPANVLAATGGGDALVKAYQAMLALGHGRADVGAISLRHLRSNYSALRK